MYMNNKSIFKFLLWVVALLTPLGSYAVDGIEGPTWYDYRDTSFDITNGGTFDNPIVITTPEQLAQLAYLVNSNIENDTYGKVFVLGADINLKKEVDGKRVQWIPIGIEATNVFKGTFLGVDISKLNAGSNWTAAMSHTISGMYTSGRPTSEYRSFYYGLFGNVSGFIGYLRLTDSEVSFTSEVEYAGSGYGGYVGLLCGRTHKHIYNVSVEGKINVQGRHHKNYVGGIVGYVGVDDGINKEAGIAHSTFKGHIEATGDYGVGGICGEVFKGNITDCASDVTIKVTSNGEPDYCNAGGIVGYISHDGRVNACVSAGTITGVHVGGVCGTVMNWHSYDSPGTAYLTSCASSCTLEGTGGNIGGILAGSVDNPAAHVFRCSFNGHIKGDKAARVGGIAGVMPDVKDELLSRCLMLGTMEPSTATDALTGAIVGEAQNSKQTIANCYYDRTLFEGLTTGNDSTHVTIKGLTTAELTTGVAKDVHLLDIDESAKSRFTLRKGYYPAIYSDEAWRSILQFEKPAGNSEWINKLFDKDVVDQSNTVYRYGAWLCSVPAVMPKGDAAFDLVSQVTAPATNGTWTETDRNVAVESTVDFPEAANFLEIDGKTAKVTANGAFDVTIGGKLTKKAEAVFNRPAPLITSKKLHFTATPDQLWDGTVAEDYAAGTGVREDPFLIKNGAQLARAMLNNKEGECFKLLADINLNTDMFDYNGKVKESGKKDWHFEENGIRKMTSWKAIFDGDGHIVRGMYTSYESNALFGDVTATGSISNLGLIESTFEGGNSALLAHNMDGKISNCLVQGTVRPAATYANRQNGYYSTLQGGGIAATVGPNNPEAVIEDCITAVANLNAFSDYTPFVRISEANRGTVRNCLSVVPVFYYNNDWTRSDNSAAGHNYIKDCYWLRGYENNDNGATLSTINEALGQRDRWQLTANYFPTLKTFADTDIAKLLMVPVRTETQSWDIQSLDGFSRHLEFEPGGAKWDRVGDNSHLIEIDSDMGVIAPYANDYDPSHASADDRSINGLALMRGTLGKSTIFLPMRTNSDVINRGITFEDDYAQRMCVAAFDADYNGALSLAELRAVTPEQFAQKFNNSGAAAIRTFPEFRFFKRITKLTNQLNSMSGLESIRLPYAMTTIGSEAFNGCANLKEVTLPAKVSYVEPHPFFNSGVTNVNVDPFNQNFKSRDGILFDANNGLVAYPNGRGGEEITISGVVSTIYEGAIYRINGLKRLYLDFDDYDRVIPELEYGGIETTDGSLVEVYVKDGSEDHNILDDIRNDYSWTTYSSAKKLFRYYPIKVDETRATTMYLGFDVELPRELTPYIAASAIPAENAVMLQEMERLVPKLSPVVLLATEPGLYRLLPRDGESLQPWKMYRNRLNGSGADGIPIYAEDSSEGGIYSLQMYKKLGIPYFDYCQEEMFPPYRAYLPYNSIGDELPMGVHFMISQEITDGDWQAYAIPHVSEPASPDDEPTITYTGVLSDYDGSDRNIVVPTSLTASVLNGEPVEIKLVGLGSNIFAESKDEIWNLDFTRFTEPLRTYDMAYGKLIDEVTVDRNTEGNPFYDIDPKAYIYLNNGNQGPDANAIVNGQCQWLTLYKDRDFLPPVDINADVAMLDYSYLPAKDLDGQPLSKAFTVVLPFEAEILDNAKLYTLRSVDQLLKHFVFTPTKSNIVQAGKPYVMIVESQGVYLSGKNVIIKRQTNRDDVTSWEYVGIGSTKCGYWDGTYATVDNATAARQTAYAMQFDGTFQRIRGKYEGTFLSPYSAFFTSGGDYSSIYPAIYTMVIADADDTYAQNVEPFPATEYESDADMSGYNVPFAVLWCGSNRTLYFTAEEDGYKIGDRYNDALISDLWTGNRLLNLGKDEPQWLSSNAVNAERIVFDASCYELRPKTMHAWFKGMKNLKTLEGLDWLNTSDVKDMSQLFQGCTSLEMLDLSNFTVDVTDATQMFQGCTSLTTIFTNGTWKVNYAGHEEMFDDCTNLIGARTYSEGYTDGYWANSVVGYFTPEPYVLWCTDNQTLYFTSPNYKLEVDGEYDGQTITALWKGIAIGRSDSSDPAWRADASSARRVVFDPSFAKQRPCSLSRWFYNYMSLAQIDGLEHLNTSQATEANYMFYYCHELKELDVNTFDMSNVQSANWMFGWCDNLWTIWCDNTWNIPSADYMFSYCRQLKGAVSYNPAADDGTMANPTTGYFTATPTIELKDDQENYDEFFAQYDGKRVNVRYDREFTATKNGNGTWNRKAYTVCLPYDKTLYLENSRGQISLYTLAAVTDDGHFIFGEYGQAELKAGHPYLMVVNEGTVSLDADNVRINKTLFEGTPVFATFDDWVDQNMDAQVGVWRGMYDRIYAEDVEPQQIYGQQKTDGRWLRYRDFKKPKTYWLGSMRAVFEALEPMGSNVYYPQFGYMPDGPAGARHILPFPAEDFDGDDLDIGETEGIRDIFDFADGDARYFDLQGRPLSSKPTKGLYIEVYNGRKVTKIIKK